MAFLKQQFHHQVAVLTISDLFCVLAALLVVLMVFILVVPVRTFPPWIVFAPRGAAPATEDASLSQKRATT